MVGDTGSPLELFPRRVDRYSNEDRDYRKRWRAMVSAAHSVAEGVLSRALHANRMTEWDAMRTAHLIDAEYNDGDSYPLPGPWPDAVEAVQRVREFDRQLIRRRQWAALTAVP